MALLSQMIRSVAITGRTDQMNAWFADRQGRRWAQQTMERAFPPPRPRGRSLEDLTELHRRGVVSDAEFEQLRARLRI